MNSRSFYSILLTIASLGLGLTSCEDEVSEIGGLIRPSEVTINVDSASYNLHGKSIAALEIDSRSTTSLLGTIDTESYGRLECSFVTQLLPAESISLPDSIKSEDVDSVKLIMRIPRSQITGDSLSPQQVTVYRLTEQLPANISSTYNPEGKYSSVAMGSANYTLSALSMGSTANLINGILNIQVPMPRKMGVDAIRQYREDSRIFEWPQLFAKEFPGLYLKSTFGKGCVAALQQAGIYAYTHHQEYRLTDEDKNEWEYVDVKDSTCLFISAPEVLSSNIISYKPSDTIHQLAASGEAVVTTPGGYIVDFVFPAADVLKAFTSGTADLGVINNLSMSIPGEKISNTLGIGVPPTLLMVKRSEATKFLEQGKMPDNINSFVCTWNSTKAAYILSDMRQYIEMLSKQSVIKEEEMEFVLIPVATTTETSTLSDGSTQTVYTSCVPYLQNPTMVRLLTNRATIVFTYSNQELN